MPPEKTAPFFVLAGPTASGKSELAVLVADVFLGAAVCVLHFKFILQDELRAWYLIFTLPFVILYVFHRVIPLFPGAEKKAAA